MRGGFVTSALYHGTPVIPHKTGMLRYCSPLNNRCAAILAGAFAQKVASPTKSPFFTRKPALGPAAREMEAGIDMPLSRSH